MTITIKIISKRLKIKPRNPLNRKKIDYNFDLRIIFLLLSIVKINIFNEKLSFQIII